MKLSQLLAGTAAVALLAAASYADTAVVIDTGVPGANGITGNVSLVPELDFGSGNFGTTLELSIVPDANEFDVYANTAAQLTISFDGFELASNIAGGSIFSDWSANGNANSNCAMTVVAGGAMGDTSVTFETPNLGACDDAAGGGDDDMGFRLPVTLTDVPANFSFEIRQKANNALIASNDYNNGNPLVNEANGFEVEFNANSDLQISLSDPSYNALDDHEAGWFEFNSNGDVDLNGNAADWSNSGQVDSIEVVVTLSSPTGIESVTIEDNNSNNTMTANLVNGVATFTIDYTTDIDLGDLDGYGLQVTLTEDTNDNTLINNGGVSVTVTADADSTSELLLGSFTDDLADLVREGTSDGPFEWVGDSTKSTLNIFRVTGIDDTLPIIRVSLENSTVDLGAPIVEYVLTPSNAPSNGELIITSGDITNAVGVNFGRADVTFSYEANDITTRRLMATAGVVSENSTDY